LKKHLFVFLTVIFGATINTQAQPQKADQSLLWRISGKNLSRPSYLFGTIHLICQNEFLWTDTMASCFSKCSTVCFEMDMSNPTVMTQAAMAMTDNTGKQLKDYFTEAEYLKISKYLKSNTGIDIQLLSRMKPIALLGMISAKSAACAQTVSYEDTLGKMAATGRKKTMGLETPAEQMSVLDKLPFDTLKKELLSAIDGPANGDALFASMVSAYTRQDLPSLDKIIQSDGGLGESGVDFIDNRNAKWIPLLERQMEVAPVFTAVGAGHLYGNHGLINLLRKEGYRVEPAR
jgi:uncharacterized protein